MTEAEREAIKRACEEVNIAYARHVDFREMDALIDTFTVDCELEAMGQKMNGHKGLIKFMEDRPASRKSLHVLTNIWVNVLDADRAEGKTYFLNFRNDAVASGPAPHTTPVMVGYMDDNYARTPGGWKFSRRRIEIMFMNTNQ